MLNLANVEPTDTNTADWATTTTTSTAAASTLSITSISTVLTTITTTSTVYSGVSTRAQVTVTARKYRLSCSDEYQMLIQTQRPQP